MIREIGIPKAVAAATAKSKILPTNHIQMTFRGRGMKKS
jgi:hypothetical protein